MRVSLESTNKLVRLNGISARIWEGTTEAGVKVHCYMTRIAVKNDQPLEVYAEFERELKETRVPSADVEAIPLRMIL